MNSEFRSKASVDEIERIEKPSDISAARTFPSEVKRKALRKLDFVLLPILTLVYLTASLDKSNLGNAKALGIIEDIGSDPTGSRYALLQATYFITYAPLMVPLALLGKRTRMEKILTICAIGWGIAATCMTAVHNFGQAYVCRLLTGLGEAGFGPLIQVYMSRFYTRQALGVRVAFWLAMAPIGGFINGMVAYGVSFIHSSTLESWRVLFLIEGLLTVASGAFALLLLPENIKSCKWLNDDEKEYLIHIRSFDFGAESHKINWKHARGAFYRWAQILPVLMYGCQQITGQALAAFLPTLTRENGFTGANAQIATLAPYGAAAVTMVLASWVSDRYKNRGWPCQCGWFLSILGFAIYLAMPATSHGARFAALIFAECGHYITTPLIVTWQANNSGNESRRAVAVPLAIAVAAAIAAGSGYLFPAADSPKYTMGSAVSLALSTLGSVLVFIYQILIFVENRNRNKRDGGSPREDFQPDTATYADLAPGFRYYG